MIAGYYKILLSGSEPDSRVRKLVRFHQHLGFLESTLKKRGTLYFRQMDDQPGMLDYMIWPWLERVDIVPFIFTDIKELIPKSQFPLLVRHFRLRNVFNSGLTPKLLLFISFFL